MTDEELEQRLSNIEKRQDRILTLLTKVLKVMHVIPVTKEEEEKIQITQRKNMALLNEVNHELNVKENKPDDGTAPQGLTLHDVFNNMSDDVYEDIIGDDFIDRSQKEV